MHQIIAVAVAVAFIPWLGVARQSFHLSMGGLATPREEGGGAEGMASTSGGGVMRNVPRLSLKVGERQLRWDEGGGGGGGGGGGSLSERQSRSARRESIVAVLAERSPHTARPATTSSSVSSMRSSFASRYETAIKLRTPKRMVRPKGGGKGEDGPKVLTTRHLANRKSMRTREGYKEEEMMGTIDYTHAVVMWGRGDDFRLGTGDDMDRASPTITMVSSCPVKMVACGSMHTVLLMSDSRVFTWGGAIHGQLGHGPLKTQNWIQPAIVTSLLQAGVVSVAAGGLSSMAVTSGGSIMAWGDNSHSKLGLGSGNKERNVWSPMQVSDVYDQHNLVWIRVHYTQAWVGHRHSAGVDKQGKLYVWGDNSSGQLGLGDRATRQIPNPSALSGVKVVSLGLKHSAAIDERRILHTWGDTGEGRLGHGQLFEEEKPGRDEKARGQRKPLDALVEPKVVETVRGREVVAVSCGDRFTAAVDAHGEVWTFGSGVYGQLGRGREETSSDAPGRVIMPTTGRKLRGLVTCSATMAFWDDNGRMLGCGRSGYGIITEDDSPSFTPTAFGIPPGPVSSDFWPTKKNRLIDDEDEREGGRNAQLQHLGMGEAHCCAVLKMPSINDRDCNEFGMGLDQVPNSSTGGYVMLATCSDANPLNRLPTHKVGTKRDRYGGRDLYGNVVGVDKENGLVVLDMGGEGRVKMKLSDIRKTLPTSLSTIRTEARLKKEPLTEEGDAKMEGFDLLEVLEEMHKGDFELHPLLQDATPAQCSSAWDVYNRPVAKDTGSAATDQQRATLRRNSITPGEEKVSFKQSMAVEEADAYQQFHNALSESRNQRVLHAHNRAPHGSGAPQNASSLRMVYINGNQTSSCGSIFGPPPPPLDAEASSKNARLDVPGPGAYHLQGSLYGGKGGIKLCGVGITLSSKKTDVAERDLPQSIFVKSMVKDGPAMLASQGIGGSSGVSVNDLILSIDSVVPNSVFHARQLLTGEPNTPVSITYKHKSKTGTHTHTIRLVRAHIPGVEPEIFPPSQGSYVGLGLKADRFSMPDEVEEGVESAIVEAAEELRNETVGGDDSGDLLGRRHGMIPPQPGIKRVTQAAIRNHPELSEELEKAGLVGRVMRKHGLMQERDFMAASDNPVCGPGNPVPRGDSHGWNEDGTRAGAWSGVTKGVVPWREPPPKREAATYLSDDEVRAMAMQEVFGRVLDSVEYDRLAGKKRRMVDDAFLRIRRQHVPKDEVPGPIYNPNDGKGIGASKPCHDESEAGHHIRGVAMGVKLRGDIGGGTLGPGPGAYDVSGGVGSSKGTPRFHEPVGLPPRVDISASKVDIPGALSSLGNNNNVKTPYSNAPIHSMCGRGSFEAEKNRQAGLYWDSERHEWVPQTPGPAAYVPKQPPVTRTKTMLGRDALVNETRLKEGQKINVFEVSREDGTTEMLSEWVLKDSPAPGDYTPSLTNDGRALGAAGAPSALLLQRMPERERGVQDESPGPGAYNIRSCFDPSPVGGTRKGEWVMGELPPHEEKELEPRPAPGDYDVMLFDGLGTDKVGIGAAARQEKGISSTQLVREVKLGLREPDTKDSRAIVVNYSEMNKSLDKLKAGLITRFNNVYEAFVFMDRGGDWMITCNEFKMQSKSLKINVDPMDMKLCLKRLDNEGRGAILAKQYVDCLWWGDPNGPGCVAPTSAIFAQRMQAAVHSKKETAEKVERMLDAEAHKRKLDEIRAARLAERQLRSSLTAESGSLANLKDDMALLGAGPRKKKSIKSYVPKPPGYSTRPLSARVDMRRGFSLGAKIPRAMHRSGDDTPGPAGYELEFAPGAIGNYIGKGKNPYSREAGDALCWAGSWVTTKAAPISPQRLQQRRPMSARESTRDVFDNQGGGRGSQDQTQKSVRFTARNGDNEPSSLHNTPSASAYASKIASESNKAAQSITPFSGSSSSIAPKPPASTRNRGPASAGVGARSIRPATAR